MKTPEQMAEEAVEKTGYHLKRSVVDGTIMLRQGMDRQLKRQAFINGFLAGYQAGMNSPEKQDSCEHILDMEKMVDVNPSSGWISVKERLPEHGVPVLVFDTLANTIELMSWDKIMEVFETDDAYFVQLNDASHWMPLPKPPEEK